MLRFSLAALLLVVLLAALSCAALLYASEMVKQATVSLAVLVLLLATLWAVCGRGRRRAAAAGFALAGWVYLLLTHTAALSLEQHLLTANANRWLYATLHEEAQPQPTDQLRRLMLTAEGEVSLNDLELYFLEQQKAAQMLALQELGTDGPFQVRVTRPLPVPTFNTIGHALWALWLGLLGALAAGTIYACSRRPEATANN